MRAWSDEDLGLRVASCLKTPIALLAVLNHPAGVPCIDSGTSRALFGKPSWAIAAFSASPLVGHPRFHNENYGRAMVMGDGGCKPSGMDSPKHIERGKFSYYPPQ